MGSNALYRRGQPRWAPITTQDSFSQSSSPTPGLPVLPVEYQQSPFEQGLQGVLYSPQPIHSPQQPPTTPQPPSQQPSRPPQPPTRPPRHESPDWETADDDRAFLALPSSSSSNSSTASDSSSSKEERPRKKARKTNKKTRKKGKKGNKTSKRRTPRIRLEERKVLLRLCVEGFDVYAHAKPKRKFWEHIAVLFEKETAKHHNSLDKTINRWVKGRRTFLRELAEGKHSGEEEDDTEFVRALDEWIECLDSLEEKEAAYKDKVGVAEKEGKDSRRLQENLARRMGRKERSPPSESIEDDLELRENDEFASIEAFDDLEGAPPARASSARASSTSISSRGRPSSHGRRAPSRARQQPFEAPALAQFATAFTKGIEKLAEAVLGVARGQGGEADVEAGILRKRLESVEQKILASEQKQDQVLLILSRLEEAGQKRRREGEG